MSLCQKFTWLLETSDFRFLEIPFYAVYLSKSFLHIIKHNDECVQDIVYKWVNENLNEFYENKFKKMSQWDSENIKGGIYNIVRQIN